MHQLMKREVARESKEGYMVGFGGRKGSMKQLYCNLKK